MPGNQRNDGWGIGQLRNDFPNYDALPPRLREAVRNLPFNYDAITIWEYYYLQNETEDFLITGLKAHCHLKATNDKTLIWNTSEYPCPSSFSLTDPPIRGTKMSSTSGARPAMRAHGVPTPARKR